MKNVQQRQRREERRERRVESSAVQSVSYVKGGGRLAVQPQNITVEAAVDY